MIYPRHLLCVFAFPQNCGHNFAEMQHTGLDTVCTTGSRLHESVRLVGGNAVQLDSLVSLDHTGDVWCHAKFTTAVSCRRATDGSVEHEFDQM